MAQHNENQVFTTDLPLMEAFYTLQGEGHFQGRAAYFIRLAGCDVGCHWCDVKESWEAAKYPKVNVEEIAREASQFPSRLTVITGGEPLMYDLTALCRALHAYGFQINIETSGAYPLSGELDWICFSPKKFKPPLSEFYEKSNELKIIIYNSSDFAWAESFASKMHSNCQLFLQPEWSVMPKVLPKIVEYVKQNPQWRISLQTHKFMNIP
ncbi:MAG: 7-carboxy-7-deazaguanine synthase QueE [Microscillaceae bacterium]|nr:7-carboxy-7-deazaguanine synthase QueE [Microscillaceae bacterium]MDW8461285.1 7-carboxy-7-deazaguanine synthase QueE [Cytophagales bacterium]